MVTNFIPAHVRMPESLESLAPKFLDSISHAVAPTTLAAYRTDLQQFVGYCLQRRIRTVHFISPDLVTEFLHAMLEHNGCIPRTVARKLSSVRLLMEYAVDMDLVEKNPCAKVRPPKVTIRPVIAPEIDQIMRLISLIPTDSPEDVRDRAILLLILTSAMRPSGALSLDIYDAQNPPINTLFPDGSIYYCAKGGDTKQALTTPLGLEAVNQWLEVRPDFDKKGISPAIFISRLGKRLHRQTLFDRLKEHASRAGLSNITLRHFRHARARQVIDELGYDAAQALLGHKNRNTTVDVYGHADKARALAATGQLELPPAAQQLSTAGTRGSTSFAPATVSTGDRR